MELYQKSLWDAWTIVPEPRLVDIPPNRAQLIARVAGGESFDGGQTATWLTELGDRATWRAARDARTGHAVHVVSDRPVEALTSDIRLGLRLLAWMSSRPIVWFWWDHNWQRILPATEDPGRLHVNGGWATPGILEVNVYRREEAHKVLLHESIHALGLDVPHSAVEPVRRQFEQEFGRRLWPHLGEAFTELLAEWLWAIAQASSLRSARLAWAHQMVCAEHQAGLVWARIRDATADEDTNVFAYYILKWVLMRMRNHLTEALIGSDHSVKHWYAWWREARPTLELLSQRHSTQRSEPMGMTCGAGR